MANENVPETTSAIEPNESFTDLLSQFDKERSRKKQEGAKGLEGTVITVTADSVVLDIGYKTEGILPLAAFGSDLELPKPGDKIPVTIKGRDPEGYYELGRGRVQRPVDWDSLQKAFDDKEVIAGTVTAVVKGGLSVDVGVRAFMPASRSWTKDATEMEKLVGQEIRCIITKLDVTEEDVVVDRRAVAQGEERAAKEKRFSELVEGDTVSGVVRSVTDYGAFVDIGGVDGLLHVSDISWSRVGKPSEILSPGQQVEAKVLKIDTDKKKVSLGLKQLQPHPWDAVAEKYKVGEKVRGTVSRIAEFGAFVELEPGIEGLIHISEMSWGKKVRKASDLIKPGENVEVVILAISPGERRISLGLKQAMGDPWTEINRKFPVGSVVEGPVTSLMKFGAFVQVTEGIEGMIHISDITDERRLNHPQDVLKSGQVVKAQVLEIDMERRRLKLGMKQLVPTGLDDYLVEHKEGDSVTGRIVEFADGRGRVELGDGVFATCRMSEKATKQEEPKSNQKADLASLSSMLQARWKSGGASGGDKDGEVRAGQIRSFKIAKLDAGAKTIELELA